MLYMRRIIKWFSKARSIASHYEWGKVKRTRRAKKKKKERKEEIGDGRKKENVETRIKKKDQQIFIRSTVPDLKTRRIEVIRERDKLRSRSSFHEPVQS